MNDVLLPLLKDRQHTKTPSQKAIRKILKLTAHLANLLPTGSVLAFQILSPVLNHQAQCRSTVITVALCAVSCFLLCFTDSFRDARGKVRYGVATLHGLWVIDGSAAIHGEDAAKYRLRFMDFLHAVLSVMVFGTVAMFDGNVVGCLYPMPSEEGKKLLAAVPVGVGVVCSMLFWAFPTTRHGIGFPLSRH